VCLQYFDTVGWVWRPVKNRRPYNLYCVGGDVKPCSINQSISHIFPAKLSPSCDNANKAAMLIVTVV